MNRIKDFFYNKNDIIIVLIILAAAAFIIYTRIGVIMDYPEKLAAEAASSESEQSTTAQSVEETSTAAESTASTAASESSNTTSAKTVSVTISDSDDSSTVSEMLYKEGLVDSPSNFEGYVNTQGMASSLQTGTFKIPEGATYEEILDIITN